MRAGTEEYKNQLQALLPVGRAWPREEDAQLTGLLRTYADELARAHNRGVDLTVEALPSATSELIEEWEAEVGLPDCCVGAVSEDLDIRRVTVAGRLTARGGQSRHYFEDLAFAYGWVIDIEEFDYFLAGQNAAGDLVWNGDVYQFSAGDNAAGDALERVNPRFLWRIWSDATEVAYFAAGESAAGDQLVDLDNAALRCLVARLAPAHTVQLFSFLDPDPVEPVTFSTEEDFTAGTAVGYPLQYTRIVTLAYPAAASIEIRSAGVLIFQA